MKFFLIVTLVSSAFSTISFANATDELANGNRIAEPALSDYSAADRKPGFSTITDVVDENGNPVSPI